MRKVASLSLLAIALLLVAPMPSDAWRGGEARHGARGRVFITATPAFWWGPYPYWWYYPPPYYAPPYYVYYSPPPVVVQEPPVYVQAAPAPAPPQAYWYYCPNARAYYPTAPTCAEPWVKVPPRPE